MKKERKKKKKREERVLNLWLEKAAESQAQSAYLIAMIYKNISLLKNIYIKTSGW